MEQPSGNEVIIFQPLADGLGIEVRLEGETVWLSQAQMAQLFERDKRTISEHIGYIFKEGELAEDAVVRKFRITAGDGKQYLTQLFNLDVIISVGYRVKSKRGTQFRIWATEVLRRYLTQGYALNQSLLQQREVQLQELRQAVGMLERLLENPAIADKEARLTSRLITQYARSISLLDAYDHDRLELGPTKGENKYIISYDEAKVVIKELKKRLESEGQNVLWFGNEKDESFKSSVASIYQSFGGVELYPSVEEKAANLLYFVVKNHSFTDGNKRIAAFLFVWFLERNGLLTKADGSLRVAENTLVALTLLIAISKPEEREGLLKLTVNLVNSDN